MTRRPNILVFMTDDHGQWASGCYGNREVRTPTIDWLAGQGARMARAYTPSPVCSPARACFFTGRLPSQHGIHDYIYEPHPNGRAHPGLRGQTTIAQLLQATGYHTTLSGKWHCGDSWVKQPGFDRWFSYNSFQFPHKGKIQFSDEGRIVDHVGHQSTAITDHAVKVLRERDRTRPFFHFVGYVNTHTPLADQPERLAHQYRSCNFADVRRESFSPAHGHINFGWTQDEATHREWMAQYYAAASFIDHQMGRVIDEVDNAGELDNTLIIYTGDHGHINGQHGFSTKGNGTVPQNFIDESILVPCVMRWKEGLPAGHVENAQVDHCDLFHTLLDVAEAPLDEATRKRLNSPGRSYLPLIRGDQAAAKSWRDAYFGDYGNARCIRTDTHKFIRRYPGPNGSFGDELYDLQADPRERENVIANPAHAATLATLSRRLDEHFAQYEDPARAGKNIATQPRCGEWEPWVIKPWERKK